MKNGAQFDLDAECNFLGLPPQEITTACVYEYMRESRRLRDALIKRPTTTSRPLPLFAYKSPWSRSVLLIAALRQGGFPKPWNTLKKNAKRRLIKAISGWDETLTKPYPPLVVEEAAPERDLESESEQFRTTRTWQLKPSEPKLLRGWEESERQYFFGFIRIDKSYDKTDVAAAFEKWFAKKFRKRLHGNPQHLGKLVQLAAMRVRQQYKRAERQKILAAVTGKAAYKREQHVTDSQLSRDCKDALKFFRRLFPGQRPISITDKS